MVSAELTVGVISDCWTAKQPPKGPATALLRQRTVQMLPVEAGILELWIGKIAEGRQTSCAC